MNRMFIDLETRSDADITRTGVYRYADSPCFDILLFAVSIDDAPVQVYYPLLQIWYKNDIMYQGDKDGKKSNQDRIE